MSDSDEYPRSAFVKILSGIGVFLVLVSFLLPVLFWSAISGHVPAHINFFGEVDSWGGKGNLFILPGAGLIVFGLLFLVAGSPISNYPFTITEENAERQYALGRTFGTVISIWIIAGLTYIEWMMIQLAQGSAMALGRWFGVVFLGGIIVITAQYFVKAFLAR